MSKRPSGKKTRSASAPSAAATTRPEFHWTAPARWSWLLGLGVLLAVALFLRWHFFDFPLERDESAYAYLGKRVLDGQVPYRDMYEMKPPLLFYSYAALVAVFGYSAGGIHLAAFVLTLWNAIWLMAVGARLFGLFYGFVAGLCWVLLTANPAANAILLESELLIMAWVLPGLYCLLRWDAAPGAGAGKWWLLASGFLLACGILVKQSALFFLGAPAMLLLWRYWTERPRQLAGLVRNAGWFAAGVLGPVVFFGLLLWSQGAWSDFWFWNVQYLSVYSSGLKKDLWLQAFTFNFDLLTRGFGLYWLLGLVGLFTLLRPGLPGRHRALLFGLLLFAAAAVVPGWRFYAHYWLQLLPVLALLIALQFYQIERGAARVFTQRHPRLLVAGLAVILLVTPVLQNGVLLFKSDHDRTIRSLFPGNPYAEDKTLAGLIGSKIRPDDRIAVLGSEPQYYVYLDRPAPSKHFYMAFCMRPIPESKIWQQEALDSIRQQAPRFVVFNFVEFSWMVKSNSDMTLYEQSYKYTRENYRPIAWADMVSLTHTEYVLDEAAALNYQPQGQRYVTVYERK